MGSYSTKLPLYLTKNRKKRGHFSFIVNQFHARSHSIPPKNIRKSLVICSKLAIKIPDAKDTSVSIVSFEQVNSGCDVIHSLNFPILLASMGFNFS